MNYSGAVSGSSGKSQSGSGKSQSGSGKSQRTNTHAENVCHDEEFPALGNMDRSIPVQDKLPIKSYATIASKQSTTSTHVKSTEEKYSKQGEGRETSDRSSFDIGHSSGMMKSNTNIQTHSTSKQDINNQQSGGKGHGVMPERHDAIPDRHDAMPERHGTMPERHDAMPERHGAMPEIHNAMPERHGAMPERHGAMPEIHNAMPERHDAMPERHGAMPERHGAMPERHDAMPERHAAIPERHDAMPDRHDAMSERHDAMPERHDAMPDRHYAMPEHDTTPRQDDIMSQQNDTTTRRHDIVDEQHDTKPKQGSYNDDGQTQKYVKDNGQQMNSLSLNVDEQIQGNCKLGTGDQQLGYSGSILENIPKSDLSIGHSEVQTDPDQITPGSQDSEQFGYNPKRSKDNLQSGGHYNKTQNISRQEHTNSRNDYDNSRRWASGSPKFYQKSPQTSPHQIKTRYMDEEQRKLHSSGEASANDGTNNVQGGGKQQHKSNPQHGNISQDVKGSKGRHWENSTQYGRNSGEVQGGARGRDPTDHRGDQSHHQGKGMYDDEEPDPALVEKYKGDEESKFEYFWQGSSAFSQWHRCKFVVAGIEYTCAEQFMMHRKAMLFEDYKTARKILQTNDPRQQKKLGRQVANFIEDVWQHGCDAVVEEGNMYKFSQNDDMLNIIFATYPKILVEASPMDRIWGIGLYSDDPRAWNRATWRGQNKLGMALTKVRNRLMVKRDMMQEADFEEKLAELML